MTYYESRLYLLEAFEAYSFCVLCMWAYARMRGCLLAVYTSSDKTSDTFHQEI